MRITRWASLGLLLALLASGCGGPTRFQTRGRLLRDGAPLKLAEDDIVRVTFIPIPEGGETVLDWYVAEVNKADGTFRVVGKDGKGLPPGKYRVAVEHLRKKRDLLQGAFDSERSPVVCQIASASDEVTVDLARPKG